MNKKGDGGLVAIVIILIAVIFLGWLVVLGGRECNSNKDCKDDSYCGSDFSCHKYPIIEKTVTVTKGGYTLPTIIASITIVVLAIIVRWEKMFGKKENKAAAETQEAKSSVEPQVYYTSQATSKQ